MKSGARQLLEALRPRGNQRRGVILVVDDERPLLTALERQFRAAGYHPLTATTIEGAWKILGSSVTHVVIADERLDDGSGAYFLVDVGRRYHGIARLLLTGFPEPRLADLGREHGFAMLDKACQFRELLAAVKNELGDA
jgi:DNA-binding NtrC family response regulator